MYKTIVNGVELPHSEEDIAFLKARDELHKKELALNVALSAIQAKEAEATERLKREAILGSEYAINRLKKIDEELAALRAKYTALRASNA